MKTPQQLHLPKKFQNWRPGQGELVEQIANSAEKVFLLEAPTGTGKSLIGIAVHRSRLLSQAGKEALARLTGKSESSFERQCIYITRTKQLQDQILAEFPMAKTMKGRNNYVCTKHKKDFPEFTAEDCTSKEQDCGDCPYLIAKRWALRAPLAVLNTSYFLTEANGPGGFSGADLLIIDEVDALENELMNHIQFQVTTKHLNRLGLELPKDPSTLQGWLVWADALDLSSQVFGIQAQLELIPEEEWSDVEIGMHKQANRLRNFIAKVKSFVHEVNDSWIFSEQRNDEGEKTWTFKPVRIDAYTERYLWRHAKRFLGMSGTILNAEVVARDLGIGEWDYARSVCPFPLSNRPIYYTPVVNLNRSSMPVEMPKLTKAVGEIMERYPNDKVLVHTVSFQIRDYLVRELLISGRTITHSTFDRNEVLEKFKWSKDPLVLFSPSLDRGVDLPGDMCRCIVICKVPYISLGDPQVKARIKMPGGEAWYLLKAAQTIMQMSGRGIRSEADRCDTYILDRQFSSLLNHMKSYFPQWWLEAIQWT